MPKLRRWHIAAALVAVLVASPFVVWLLTPTVGTAIVLRAQAQAPAPAAAPAQAQVTGLAWVAEHARAGDVESWGDDWRDDDTTGDSAVDTVIYLDGLDRDFDATTVELLHEWLAAGAQVVAEIPTWDVPMDAFVRRDIERIFGVRATGWSGRRVNDLAAAGEVPAAIRISWETENGEPWRFAGPGVLLAHADGRIVVLNEALHTERPGLEVHRGGARVSYSAEWFALVEPAAEAVVTAEYVIPVNAAGRDLLSRAGLPARFPAIIDGSGEYHDALLLSGDLSAYLPGGGARVAGFAAARARLALAAPDARDHLFWTVWVPEMIAVVDAVAARGERAARSALSSTSRARLREGSFEVTLDGGSWQQMHVLGINLGMAVPGRYFTTFPASDLQYLAWLEAIHAAHYNTIRVYTLQHAAFYRALQTFNLRNPDRPLWLLQEVWPEEHPPNNNLLDTAYVAGFEDEIRYAVDAIHGAGEVPARVGRAAGSYRHDVSPWLLGWLVGREVEPAEVAATNSLNGGATWEGRWISSTAGRPTEVWLARSLDSLVDYAWERHGSMHPVSIVSWPPLDALVHESERLAAADLGAERAYNDSEVIDINLIDVEPAFTAGLFGSYHIYPNYPDFIINSPDYAEYRDGDGQLNMGGYLREFATYHSRYPALVAEFGMATGFGVAHVSPDGLDHGGVSGAEQALGIVRMFEAIEREGYLGGVVFQWMDEWVKKTWTTEPFILPYERNPLWHNILDPEQNYGLMAWEPVRRAPHPVAPRAGEAGGAGAVAIDVAAGWDADALTLEISLSRPLAPGERLLVGLDTHDPQRGAPYLESEPPVPVPTGAEFRLTLDAESALLEAVRGYELGSLGFSSPPIDAGQSLFDPIRILINRSARLPDGTVVPAQYWEVGALRGRAEAERELTTLQGLGPAIASDEWLWEVVEGSRWAVRLPWGALNVTDPSDLRVLDDPAPQRGWPEGQDVLASTPSEGILIAARLVTDDRLVAAFDAAERVRPDEWALPEAHLRPKRAWGAIAAYLAERALAAPR